MSIVKLADYKNRETVSLLRRLLNQAQAGQISGMAMCFRTSDGIEDARFTGMYRADPGKAVNAAMRLTWKLTQMQDQAP
jgi:hypothetical protein